MKVNSQLLDAGISSAQNQLMVAKTETFSDRFEALRAGAPYQAVSDGIYQQLGVRISPQGMHKWSKGGGIDPETVHTVAKYYGVSVAWLHYGAGPKRQDATIEEVIRQLPPDSQQQVLDFIQYKIERAEDVMAGKGAAKYMKMIEGIRKDIASKRRPRDTDEELA